MPILAMSYGARWLGDDRLLLMRRAAGRLLDTLLPPRCLACGAGVGEGGAVCAPCWAAISWLGAPCCAACGLPFEWDQGRDAVCAQCARRPPPWRRARAAMRYDDLARRLVLGFKHGDRTHAAPSFARWLARAGAEVLADAELIVPVPLNRWRLARRRFNQSALLAIELQKLLAPSGPRALPDALVRHRRTPSQGGLGRAGRQRNVAGAFILHPRRAGAVAGRRIVLVDDVLTTGATAGECVKVLLRAGAARVDVLTLARVPGPAG